jgi:hypothetical protein
MVRRILRTVGRTALISGTATAVSGRVAQRQRQKLAQSHAQGRPSQPESSHAREPSRKHNDIVESLQQLAELKASGALTGEEFKAAKAKLLS